MRRLPTPGRLLWQRAAPVGLALVVGAAAGYWLARGLDPHGGPVATVNGTPIPAERLLRRALALAGPAILRQLVREEIDLQFARRLGVYPTDAQIEAALAEARLDPNFARGLAATRQTVEDARRNLLVNLARANIVAKGVSVTDAEARAYYDRNADPANPRARYYRPEQVTASAIVTRDEPAIRAALADLARGMPFDAVARRHSVDRSAVNGGALPPLRRGSAALQRLPGLERLLFSIKPGEQSGAVPIAGQWWVVRCLAHTPEAMTPYERVREECRRLAAIEKAMARDGRKRLADLEEFRKAAKTDVHWQEYREAMQQ